MKKNLIKKSELPFGGQGYWSTNKVSALLPKWKAQWIWLPEGEEGEMMLARKEFSVGEVPEEAKIYLTASSRYELYVNGKRIGFGPARCAAHHQAYDVMDISALLNEGSNVIAIRVHRQKGATSFYSPVRGGLLAQLDIGDTSIYTDESWSVTPDQSWSKYSPSMAGFHLEVSDRVDLSQEQKGWKQLDFDTSAWHNARPLFREFGWPKVQPNDTAHHLTQPWSRLIPRDIPYLQETYVEGKLLSISKHYEGIEGQWENAELIQAIELGEIPTEPVENLEQGTAIVYDFGQVYNGRPSLTLEAPEGSVIDIISVPYLLDGKVKSETAASNYVDRVRLSGKVDEWIALYMKPTRFMAIVVRSCPGSVKIHQAGMLEHHYPFEIQGKLELPEGQELEALWKASTRSIEVCTTDAYTDNYRERRQYAQTAWYAGLGNYASFGDTSLQRRYLLQVAQEQMADGLMPAYAPRNLDDYMVILDSNCFWIRGLHQYFLYSGDKETILELLPSARKLIDLLISFSNRDGLIDNPPHPYWLDHALNDRRGANLCLNGHYLGALEDYIQVLKWFEEEGYEEEVIQLEVITHQMRRTLQQNFWDEEKQLFADAVVEGRRSDLTSEHANAMACSLNIANENQMQAVAKQFLAKDAGEFIKRGNGATIVTPAMSYFLHKGLCEAGYIDASFELLWDRFQHMLGSQHNGTLWEEWWLDGSGRSGQYQHLPKGRSDSQTESAFPPALFAEYLLGIQATAPGLMQVTVSYYPSTKHNERAGAIPTPHGVLEVEWKIGEKEIELCVNAPEAVSVSLDLESLGMPKNLWLNDEELENVHHKNLYLGSGILKVRVKV